MSCSDSFFQHVEDAKVNYKWLRGGVEFIDVIPKNQSGKLLVALVFYPRIVCADYPFSVDSCATEQRTSAKIVPLQRCPPRLAYELSIWLRPRVSEASECHVYSGRSSKVWVYRYIGNYLWFIVRGS